jgi:hypothetical protein
VLIFTWLCSYDHLGVIHRLWFGTEDGRKFDKFDPASPRFREKKIRLSVINRSQNDETHEE